MDRWWQRLASVRELEFQAVSPADRCNWNGEGSGDVRVEQQEAELLFHETGAWTPQGGRPIRFTNTYRWTRQTDRIRLEHLRFGADRPVYLFDLIEEGDRLRSHQAHPCGDDRYEASATTTDDGFELIWAIDGPNKQTRVTYRYRVTRNGSNDR